MGRKQGRALQRMGEFREEGLRACCRGVQGPFEPLLLREVRIMALHHAEGESRDAALRLQYDQSQSEIKGQVVHDARPFHHPIHSETRIPPVSSARVSHSTNTPNS